MNKSDEEELQLTFLFKTWRRYTLVKDKNHVEKHVEERQLNLENTYQLSHPEASLCILHHQIYGEKSF